MGEVKQVGHDFLWEHNTQTDSDEVMLIQLLVQPADW